MKSNMCLVFGAIIIAGCANRSADQPSHPSYKESVISTGTAKVQSSFILSQNVRRSSHRKWEGKSATIHLSHPDSTASVSGGAITLNGVAVSKHVKNGITWYQTLTGDPLSLAFDGSYHVFNVPGDVGFPAMKDSIQAPTGETSITAPNSGDTISKSAGFMLTWGPVDIVTGVYITISDTSMIIGKPREFNKILTSNTGTLTVSPSDLTSMSTGPITISVVRGNVKQAPLNPTQSYQLAAYTSYAVQAVLVP